MAIFMSEGLADIIDVPVPVASFDSKKIVKLRIRDEQGSRRLSIRVKDDTPIATIVRMVGKIATIQLESETLEFKIVDVTFRTAVNTFDIKGIVLNT